ncbi:MAG: organic solvent resistance ABC transporter ATP-binding protein [Acidobacteria bacterium]|nr:MAG: organic solvent resistance ABC transporter ATP-binding protein [Acidobacteriota bacterium]PYY21583.1 MAG: organic solvent resistance ABC transporter ATP-binding protein [Acidobacteriota bacterium]
MTIAAITNGFHPSGEVVLEFKDVELGFDQHLVLRGISFRLHRGETKVLFGVAGSGKSVILKLAMGLLKPDAGTITVLGNEVSSMPEHELFDLRRQIGMVFQESALFDSLKVEENVAFRLMEEHIPADEIRKRVTEALRFVELEQTLQKFPSELSGGMRRRVAIARAIVTQPEIILYDSPTGGLDPITSTTIVELLIKQRDVYQTSALMVTHRLQDGFAMATHYYDQQRGQMVPVRDSGIDTKTSFLILRDGKAIFDGGGHELASSDDEYIKEYVS